MTQHQLSVQARFRPEILERILRVVRHRGFRICAMNMVPLSSGDRMNIELTVASQRPVELLTVQLHKLLDVASVEIQQLSSQQIRA